MITQTLGSYKLTAKIADGGMGEVYLAVKKGIKGFEKPVVLKKILPFYSDRSEFIEMLISEANLSSKLSHPNLVQTIDFFKADSNYCLIMEHVDGVNLAEIIKRTRNSKIKHETSIYIFRKLLKGLEYAHRHKPDVAGEQIVHRDISPQNILVSYSGEIKIADFGIAKSPYSRVKTKTGEIKGKTSYMSPEQIRGDKLDCRSDLYSACVILYELIYRRRPFEGTSEYETMKIVSESNLEPRFDERNLLHGVLKILKKGLQRDKNLRYSSAEEIINEIDKNLPQSYAIEGERNLQKLMELKFPLSERKYAPILKTPIMNPQINANRLIKGKSLLTSKNRILSFTKENVTVILLAGLLFFFSPGSTKKIKVRNDLNSSITSSQALKVKRDIGRLTIDTSPWSIVYLNGKRVGESPLNGIELKKGKYVATLLFSSGQSKTKNISISPNQHSVIFEKIEKK